MSKSCVGCKFLYIQDEGYSNYTVIDSTINCAMDLNKDLPASEPYDWRLDPDNWPKTMYGRCDQYDPGPMVHLDVDGDDRVEDQTEDPETIKVILNHCRLEILRELIAALPPESKRMAQGAAVHMERAFAQLQKEHPKSAPVALGAAFALHIMVERIVDNSTEDSTKGLIQLVN